MIGYAPRTLHALMPTRGRLEINVSLRPQPVRLRTIEVREVVPIRGVEGEDRTASPDHESSIAAARNHPLLAEPNVLQALSGGEVTLRPESPSGVHIRGGASDQTGYLLDGIPVFSPYHVAGMFSAWNPDAISALRLSADAPSPADPNALSGTIAAVTRSPEARIHTRGSVSTTQARLTFDGPLGATALPPYVRVDLGIRKHWHVTIGGRDALVALFGAVTNLFDRKNILTYVRNPSATI